MLTILRQGWTQSQLAIQANSSNGMIGNIEAGKAKPTHAKQS
ncbi:MAG: helix-turn-helix transcriptional regulator [Spirochaetia bacterium]|nr:helix-turn-helix transcriptional regulator [Spirochaetia bacterium]